eukprot:SAG22_NODE_12521_length_439_cov_1.052941_1_plen_49_part_00
MKSGDTDLTEARADRAKAENVALRRHQTKDWETIGRLREEVRTHLPLI